MDNEKKISGRKLFGVLLALLFCAAIGFLLVYFGIEAGRYLVYISVPLGSLGVFVGIFLSWTGMIDKDF